MHIRYSSSIDRYERINERERIANIIRNDKTSLYEVFSQYKYYTQLCSIGFIITLGSILFLQFLIIYESNT